MSKVVLKSETLSNIANAIRTKAGIADTMTPAEMPSHIANITAEESIVLPVLSAPAGSRHIKRGKEVIDQNGNLLTGSMYNDEVYTHDGVGIPLNWKEDGEGIYCGTFSESVGDASASDLMLGKKALTDSGVIVGSHTCPTLSEMTADATAISHNILKDRVAYVKGERIVGEMGLHEDSPVTLNCGESFQIIGGYHTGDTVTANSLASQTNATATAEDIASGKTAWVLGNLLTGTLAQGGKVATGTKVVNNTTQYTHTVSGLNFTPKWVFVIPTTTSINSRGQYFFAGVTSGTTLYKYVAYFDNSDNYQRYGYNLRTGSGMAINNDGFTFGYKNLNGIDSNPIYVRSNTYHWFAGE